MRERQSTTHAFNKSAMPTEPSVNIGSAIVDFTFFETQLIRAALVREIINSAFVPWDGRLPRSQLDP
jgi:hypothetical protein